MNNKIFDNCYLVEFPVFGDDNIGFLTFFEVKKKIPFNIKRVYYIYQIGNTKGMRGPHAHKITEQVFINLNGSATYYLDNGKDKKKISINKPNIGIYIGPKVWHSIKDYSENIVFLVVASTYYDESDYLRNYDEFLDFIKKDF